jgi:ppGpp synthetase/RelA/SpoT-type nucleotidyltranferase
MSMIAEARARFILERSTFVELAEAVENQLIRRMRTAGVPCVVKGRAKDVASFVGKALRKGYADPWQQITDKVGVRVTVEDPGDIERVAQLIRAEYEVIDYQDKTHALWQEEKVGYGGVHLQVAVPDSPVVGGQCEVQVRSAAQNLWSEMSHRLLYKPGVEPDGNTRRALTRLAALMEIFDEEVTRSVNQITAIPGYRIEELINVAESLFYQYADSAYDRALSRYVLSEIGTTLPTERTDEYAATLKDFAAENDVKLASIFRRYADLDSPVLIHQPEAIIVFERIAQDPYVLSDHWDGHLPQDELDQLQAIWGD